jgi:hypothetical protein
MNSEQGLGIRGNPYQYGGDVVFSVSMSIAGRKMKTVVFFFFFFSSNRYGAELARWAGSAALAHWPISLSFL